jgi:uncharacterized lipoprotein YmbA
MKMIIALAIVLTLAACASQGDSSYFTGRNCAHVSSEDWPRCDRGRQ